MIQRNCSRHCWDEARARQPQIAAARSVGRKGQLCQDSPFRLPGAVPGLCHPPEELLQPGITGMSGRSKPSSTKTSRKGRRAPVGAEPMERDRASEPRDGVAQGQGCAARTSRGTGKSSHELPSFGIPRVRCSQGGFGFPNRQEAPSSQEKFGMWDRQQDWQLSTALPALGEPQGMKVLD